MKPELRIIAVSQRVVEVSARGEVRDCLDQAWAVWLGSLGFTPVPVPNRLESVPDFLSGLRPAGIILSGGNNLTLPVYDGAESGTTMTDAFASRDMTERALVEYSLSQAVPLLGCCRGMQYLQAHFGGRLHSLKNSPVPHVARDHPLAVLGNSFLSLSGGPALTVNSFHNYGIRQDAVAPGLLPFAISPADDTVEGFVHRDAPITGIMWHPERRNPAEAFDRALAIRLFGPRSAAAT